MTIELPHDDIQGFLDEARERAGHLDIQVKGRHFAWTADSIDPCPYCVEWRRADDGCGRWEPVNPDGSVPIAVYHQPHARCMEAISDGQ